VDRAQRRDRWEELFPAGRLALTGAFLSLILLFQPSLEGRAAILAAAAAAAWLSGRKLSPLLTILVMAGIVGANLLVPLGRKLASWGLTKAVSFEALVFISKACLGPNLRLPGSFGAFFASALRTYERILAYKGKIRARSFVADIDAALVAVYTEKLDTSMGEPMDARSAPAALRGNAYLLAASVLGLASLFIGR
jgi:hypothetical protein